METHCRICPRNCKADREKGERGLCGAGAMPRVALVSLHKWEEPCLIGADGRGAGTVFFSHCNLRCCFCQNHEISEGGKGVDVSVERLAEIFLEQQARGAAVLDLVTPTVWAPWILRALKLAKTGGLAIPVAWNTSGYESIETLESLRGHVDIFLPDLKYADEKSARSLSRAPNYFEIATKAILKMLELVGPVSFDGAGQLQRGVIIRHLVLPGHRHESMRLLDWIWESCGDRVQLSLMNQYTPMHRAQNMRGLNRRLTTFEYESVVDHARELGFTCCYVQEGSAADASFIPVFDGQGVLHQD